MELGRIFPPRPACNWASPRRTGASDWNKLRIPIFCLSTLLELVDDALGKVFVLCFLMHKTHHVIPISLEVTLDSL